MSRSRNRPRRGSNPLVEGGPGEYHAQGGAGPQVEHEGADLDAREFGVPEADIPGGVTHLVNPQAHPSRTVAKPQRGADRHKYHGVPPIDDEGAYVTPPDATEERAVRPEPEPRIEDAVPVYMVQRAAESRSRRVAITDTITLPAVGSDPERICNADNARDEVMMLCTSSAHDALFSDERSSLADAAVGNNGRAAFLSHNATTYTRVATQGEMWGTSADASPSQLAVIIVTSVSSE